MCDVGFVFSCGSLGVLWPQPDLLRHSSRKWRKERTKYGSTCVSAKRQRSPLKLTADQVALVLTRLEFRDQLLVFLDAGLGTRRGELGALRWVDCDFKDRVFDVQHSYYWRRGGHLVDTKSEASAQPLPMHPALKDGLLEWRASSLYNQSEDFVFPSSPNIP
jgi:integrase